MAGSERRQHHGRGGGAPGSAPERPPDPDGRVDLATAQRIVHAAVEQALTREDKAAAIVRARAEAATRRAARFNLLLSLGVLVALAAVLAAAVVTYRARKAAAVLSAEAGLDRPVAPPPSGVIPTQVLSGRAIYEQNKAALYVLGFRKGNRVGGLCSAFA
ncbi:MAG TPA: hypothetical protein VLS89_09735, partial [Candidatus Nanopelagicales bacterium]|nr:hypothetical protein [Candidatus Nanopelagicales bacterium]